MLDGDPAPSTKGGHRHHPISADVRCGQTAGRLKVSKNVSVSALQGLGLGLVSWQKSNVSVSSRSRKLRSRLHPCCKLINCSSANHKSSQPLLFWNAKNKMCKLQILTKICYIKDQKTHTHSSEMYKTTSMYTHNMQLQHIREQMMLLVILQTNNNSGQSSVIKTEIFKVINLTLFNYSTANCGF